MCALLFVDVPSVTYFDNFNGEDVVVDGVDNAVVALSDTVGVLVGDFDRTWWPGGGSQADDGRGNFFTIFSSYLF